MAPSDPANVRVLIRVRPLNAAEKNGRGTLSKRNVLTIDPGSSSVIDFSSKEQNASASSAVGATIGVNSNLSHDAPTGSKRRYPSADNSSSSLGGCSSDGIAACGGGGSVGHQFGFDAVHGPRSTQTDVFESVKGIVDAVAAGYNGTIVAYGQTGSGKTHTVFGAGESSSSDSGLVQRSLRALFHGIALSQARNETNDRNFQHEDGVRTTTTRASFFEIFNERVYDLLSADSLETPLNVREDASKGVYVEDLKDVQVSNTADAEKVLFQGMANRHVASTAMNRTSSRSHAVFVLSIKSVHKTKDGLEKVRTSKFTLVDLAGSERQKSTDAAGARLKEASMINKSLLCLGDVIKALVDRESTKHKRDRHVPFRNSKLTFLLRDSWGGNSKTCLVATVSPSAAAISETLSTLKFAQRAKLIKNVATVNEDTSGSVAALQAEVDRLRSELSQAQEAPQPCAQHLTPLPSVPAMEPRESNKITTEMETLMRSFSTDDVCLSAMQRKARRAEEKAAAMEMRATEEKRIVGSLKRKLMEETMVRKFKQRRIECLSRKTRGLQGNDDAEIVALCNEVDSLRRQVDAPPAAAIEWRVKYERLRENMCETQNCESVMGSSEKKRLEDTVERLLDEKISLEEKVTKLSESSSATQEELMKEVERLELELELMQERIRNAEDETDNAKQRVDDAEVELEGLRSKLSASNDSEAKEVRLLTKEAERLGLELDLALEKLCKEKEKSTSAEQRAHRHQLELECLRSKLVAAEAKEAKATAELLEEQETANNLAEEVDNMGADLRNVKCALEESVSNNAQLEIELTSAKKHLRDSSSIADDKLEADAKLSEKLAAVSKDNAILIESMQRATTDLDQKATVISELKEEMRLAMDEKENEISLIVAEKEDETTRLARAKHESEEKLKAAIRGLEEKTQSLEHQALLLKKATADLNQKTTIISEMRDEMRLAMAKKEDEIKRITRTKEESEEQSKETISGLEDKIHSLEHQASLWEAMVEEGKRCNDKLEENFKAISQEKVDLAKQVDSMQKREESLLEDLQMMREKNTGLEEELIKFRKSDEEKKGDTSDNKQEQAAKTASLEGLKIVPFSTDNGMLVKHCPAATEETELKVELGETEFSSATNTRASDQSLYNETKKTLFSENNSTSHSGLSDEAQVPCASSNSATFTDDFLASPIAHSTCSSGTIHQNDIIHKDNCTSNSPQAASLEPTPLAADLSMRMDSMIVRLSNEQEPAREESDEEEDSFDESMFLPNAQVVESSTFTDKENDVPQALLQSAKKKSKDKQMHSPSRPSTASKRRPFGTMSHNSTPIRRPLSAVNNNATPVMVGISATKNAQFSSARKTFRSGWSAGGYI